LDVRIKVKNFFNHFFNFYISAVVVKIRFFFKELNWNSLLGVVEQIFKNLFVMFNDFTFMDTYRCFGYYRTSSIGMKEQGGSNWPLTITAYEGFTCSIIGLGDSGWEKKALGLGFEVQTQAGGQQSWTLDCKKHQGL